MLDRKTKNIDASVELIEDRIKQTKRFSIMIYFIRAGIFISAIVCYGVTSLIGLPILTALIGLFVLIAFFYQASYDDHLQILLHLKHKEV